MEKTEWIFENGIEVYESYGNFKVYNGNKYLGTVVPDSEESFKECVKELNNGIDPISGMWEDGAGNSCTLDGWENI